MTKSELKMVDTDKDKIVRRLLGQKRGRYTFKVFISGFGENAQEAWDDAADTIATEGIGEYDDDYEITSFEEEDD